MSAQGRPKREIPLGGRREAPRGQHEENRMSWIDKILPPRIKREEGAARKQVPEGLWTKCPSCEAVLYSAELQKTLQVCPKCNFHMRIGARERLDAMLDAEGRYEIGQDVLPVDALKFKDSRKYPERLQQAMNDTGETDALVVMGGSIRALPAGRRLLRVRLHGRIHGLGRRRALRAGREGRDRAEGAIPLRHVDRRRTHAGGPAVAVADGEDHGDDRQAGRGEAARSSRC